MENHSSFYQKLFHEKILRKNFAKKKLKKDSGPPILGSKTQRETNFVYKDSGPTLINFDILYARFFPFLDLYSLSRLFPVSFTMQLTSGNIPRF